MDCSICLEVVEEGKELPCNHTFHTACLDRWLENHTTCPVCRCTVCEERNLFAEHWFSYRMRWMERREIEREAQQQADRRNESEERQRRLEEYESQVDLFFATEIYWVYRVNGLEWRSLKREVSLVQHQTDASLHACLFAMSKHSNDIVDAFLDLSGI